MEKDSVHLPLEKNNRGNWIKCGSLVLVTPWWCLFLNSCWCIFVRLFGTAHSVRFIITFLLIFAKKAYQTSMTSQECGECKLTQIRSTREEIGNQVFQDQKRALKVLLESHNHEGPLNHLLGHLERLRSQVRPRYQCQGRSSNFSGLGWNEHNIMLPQHIRIKMTSRVN